MLDPSHIKLQVFSVAHLNDLLHRNYHSFELEARVQPSGELRTSQIYVDLPSRILAAKGRKQISDNFGYDVSLMVLDDREKKYEAHIYCISEWSAHEIAEETAKWCS